MKKILLTLIFAAAAVCLIGCGIGDVYMQRQSFDNYTWQRLEGNNSVVFNNINIEDTSGVYDIYVSLRHTPYINEKAIKFLMQITTPDGITRESVHTINLMDRFKEKWAGDAMGDLIDIEEVCRNFVSFPVKGNYKITLTNLGTYVQTVGILDIGLRIKKSDIEGYKNAE